MMSLLIITVKTSLILTLGMLAALALRRRSAALRHWILAAAIVCAAAVPVFGLLAPSWAFPRFAAPAGTRTPDVNVSFGPIGTPVSRVVSAVPEQGSLRAPLTASASDLLVPIWLIGIALNIGALAIGMSRLRRLRSSGGSRCEPATIAESSRHMSAAFALRRPVTLERSNRQAVLFTWGVLRPEVVLPADVDGWPRERIDVVLAHEFAHIARADWLVQTIAEICKGIYWFNPLFWVACARLRHESEHACDDAVINIGVANHAYATELVELARDFGRHRQIWVPAPAMAARPSNLERRVRAMLNARVDRGPITRGGRWMWALALLLITLPVATIAQGGFATFSGTVVDQQDRLLPNATITLSDGQRNVKHETKTDGNGRFELVGLPAGDYTVEAKLLGFRNLTDTFSVNGQSVDRLLKMQVGLLEETISVFSDDGTITSTQQRGNAVNKRPNPACPAGVTNGIGGNIRPPHKVKDVRPGYPGVDGNVELSATIGTDGSVVDVQTVKTDRPELAAAAIDAVRQWEFDSTLLNCVPIEVQMNVSVNFRRRQ
jgi:beta-lactamase regulating signal transducer with metallopeptidase domain